MDTTEIRCEENPHIAEEGNVRETRSARRETFCQSLQNASTFPQSTKVQPRDDESGCDTPLRGPTFPSWSEWQLWSDYHCIKRRIDRLVWADDNRRRHGPKLHPVPFQPELCPHPSEVVFGNRAVIMLGAAVFQQLQPADYLLPPCHAAYRLTRGLAAKGGYRRVQRFAIVPVQVFLHELTRDLGRALPPANWTI